VFTIISLFMVGVEKKHGCKEANMNTNICAPNLDLAMFEAFINFL
jgi:hypothetical protein